MSGQQDFMLSVHNGKVVMHFDQPVEYAAFDPKTAQEISEQMARFAYAAFYGDVPTTTDKSQITEQLRIRAKNRIRTMLVGWVDNPPPHEVQATQLADAVIRLLT